MPTQPTAVDFNRPIFLEELDCTPTDSDIFQCNSFSTLGIHSCNHSQDVSVRCTGNEIALGAYNTLLQFLPDHIIFYSDLNECAVDNGQCEQECSNNVGSFICSCTQGYRLDSNGFNCSGKMVDFVIL